MPKSPATGLVLALNLVNAGLAFVKVAIITTIIATLK